MEIQSSTARLVTTWVSEQGLSQNQAATRLRVPPAWLRRFLAGGIRRPRPVTIRRLARGLGLAEPVVRLAVLADEANRILMELDRALEDADAVSPAGEILPPVESVISSARGVLEELSARPKVEFAVARFAEDDWRAVASNLTIPQKRALVELLGRRGS
jgi:transcriptional regulator with XRE-family HTH domain